MYFILSIKDNISQYLQYIFSLASDSDTNSNGRKILYEIHTLYQSIEDQFGNTMTDIEEDNQLGEEDTNTTTNTVAIVSDDNASGGYLEIDFLPLEKNL